MGLKNFAEGGPVESEIDKALEDIQSVQPEAMVIQQVMTMVMEMIQSGASEEQIVAALKEMGLDDEDIQQVMMMIAEQMQGQDPIQSELSQMM
jgi:Ca2+-binding EF-hand superfamily protein